MKITISKSFYDSNFRAQKFVLQDQFWIPIIFSPKKAKSFVCKSCSDHQVEVINQYIDENFTDSGFQEFLKETKGKFDSATEFLRQSEDFLLGEVTGKAEKSTVVHEAGHLLVLQGKSR